MLDACHKLVIHNKASTFCFHTGSIISVHLHCKSTRKKERIPSMASVYQENAREIPAWPSISYLLLASNSIGTIIRAFYSGNYSLLGFVFFIYLSFFCLECCYSIYHRLPRHEKSLLKNFLAFAIWCSSTAILFGVAHQFAQLFSGAAALSMYAIAVPASAFMFYVYIIHDDVENCGNNRRSNEKISVPMPC